MSRPARVPVPPDAQLLSVQQAWSFTGLGRWRWERAKSDPSFPKPVLVPGAPNPYPKYRRADLQAWLDQLPSLEALKRSDARLAELTRTFEDSRRRAELSQQAAEAILDLIQRNRGEDETETRSQPTSPDGRHSGGLSVSSSLRSGGQP
jgi:hypothetical protein